MLCRHLPGPAPWPASLARAPVTPIKPELSYFYPMDWPQVGRWVRFVRVEGRCEACGRPHGQTVRHLAMADGRTKRTRLGAMIAVGLP